jgi:sugar phosphate permease
VPWVLMKIASDDLTHWLASLLVPAVLGAVAGLIFWAATRTRPQPFQGRFS